MPYTNEVPPITAEADNDEAAGTPAMSLPQACSKMGTLSSPEDELSSDRTPLGENAGAKPANKVARRRRHGLRRLTQGVREMAINADHIEIPENGPGGTPGPTGATLARTGQSSATRMDSHPPVPPVVCPKDVRREMHGGGDIPGGGTLPGGRGDGWDLPGGGGGSGGDDPNDDVEMAPEEPEDEDPTVGHERKVYTPQTTKGREMA